MLLERLNLFQFGLNLGDLACDAFLVRDRRRAAWQDQVFDQLVDFIGFLVIFEVVLLHAWLVNDVLVCLIFVFIVLFRASYFLDLRCAKCMRRVESALKSGKDLLN